MVQSYNAKRSPQEARSVTRGETSLHSVYSNRHKSKRQAIESRNRKHFVLYSPKLKYIYSTRRRDHVDECHTSFAN